MLNKIAKKKKITDEYLNIQQTGLKAEKYAFIHVLRSILWAILLRFSYFYTIILYNAYIYYIVYNMYFPTLNRWASVPKRLTKTIRRNWLYKV